MGRTPGKVIPEKHTSGKGPPGLAGSVTGRRTRCRATGGDWEREIEVIRVLRPRFTIPGNLDPPLVVDPPEQTDPRPPGWLIFVDEIYLFSYIAVCPFLQRDSNGLGVIMAW
jgi:hypothetical protein